MVIVHDWSTRIMQLMGRELVVAVTEGGLHFATWEQVFCGEFDWRRRKLVS